MKIIFFLLLIQLVFSQQYGQELGKEIAPGIYVGVCGNNCSWTVSTDNKTLNIYGTGENGYGHMKDDYDFYEGQNDIPYEYLAEYIHNIVIAEGIDNVGKYAFDYLYNVKNVSIPRSVTILDVDAFRGMTGLEEVFIPGTVQTLGNWLFADCINLKRVKFEDPCNITSLPRMFLQHTAVTDFEVPSCVNEIVACSFTYSNVKRVKISQNVNNINSQAFSETNFLEEISVVGLNQKYASKDGMLYDKNFTEFKVLPLSKKMSRLKLPETVVSIGSNALFANKCLKTIIFTNPNLNKVYTYVARFSVLESLTIPEPVADFGNSFISDTPKLKYLSLGNSTYSFGSYAISRSSFEKLTVFGNNPNFGSSCVVSGKVKNFEMYGSVDGASCSNNALNGVTNYTFYCLPEYENKQMCKADLVNNLQWTYEGTLAKNTNIKWKVDIKERKLTITVDDSTGNKEIPDYTEKQLPEYGHWQDVVRNVEIDTKITKIGNYAFYSFAHVSKLTLPTSLESIGDNSFGYWQQLEEVKIPTSVKTISNKAFKNCVSMISITVENANEHYKSVNGVLYEKIQGAEANPSDEFSNLKIHIWPPQAEVKEYNYRWNEVPSNLFYDNSVLENITFTASGNITIKSDAFQNSYGLKNVKFPNAENVIIEGYAFKNCHFLESIDLTKASDIGQQAFYNCHHLNNVVLSKTIKIIKKEAFYNCSAMVSFEIGPNVEKIEDKAFLNCTNLIFSEIPESVTSIGKEAFFEMSQMRELTIKGNLTFLGDGVFKNCFMLRKVTYTKGYNLDYIPTDYMQACYSLENITIPKSVKTIKGYSFKKCYHLLSVKFEEGNKLENIENSAFEECISIRDFTFPSTLKKLGKDALKNCKRFPEVFFPASITEVPASMCNGWINLHTIHWTENLTKIGDHAFANCSSLKTVEIPETIVEIGKGVFLGSKGITQTSLVLKNVKAIGEFALSTLPLKTVVFGYNIPTNLDELEKGLQFDTFNKDTLTSVTLFSSFFSFYDSYDRPEGEKLVLASPKENIVEYIKFIEGNETDLTDERKYKQSVKYLQEDLNLEIVTLVDCKDMTGYNYDSKTNILRWFGAGTISNKTCLNLLGNETQYIKKMIFEEPIDGIAEEMFIDLPRLETIVLPKSMKNIRENAFSGCSKLLYVEYPSTKNEITNCHSTAFVERKRDVDYLIMKNFGEKKFCGMKVYNSTEDVPKSETIVINPEDDVNYVKPKRPRDGAETIMEFVMLMIMFMMILI